MIKLAILDDDQTHLKLIEQALQGGEDVWIKQLDCRYFTSGVDLKAALSEAHFDGVILDRQVSDISGDDLLRWIRVQCPPQTVVLIVTCLMGAGEVAAMLSAGADDYVTKPFEGVELLARVRRFFERRALVSPANEPLKLEKLFGCVLNRTTLSILTPTGAMLSFTEREYSLLEFMFKHEGQPLSRAQIFESVWQRPYVDSSRVVDALVHRVRMRMGLNPDVGFVLHQIYGFGYRLDVVKKTGASV